jgi:predicted Zn-dependent peptidase
MTTAINTGPDRTTAPSATQVRNLTVQPAASFLLDNGIPVYSVNAGFQDLVRIEFLFGNRSFDPESPLLNITSNRLITEGTHRHSALELAEMIDDVGAFLETEESADSCSVVLYTLNKHLEKTLPVVQEILFEAAYPDSELKVFTTKQKQRLVVENEKVNSLARRHFNRLLFGNKDPYGFFAQPEDYDRITRDDLARYHAAHYTAANCTVLVAGKIYDKTFQLLNERFGKNGWGQGSPVRSTAGEFPTLAEHTHYIHKEGALQSAIRIGKRMINRTHPDYPGLAVLNTLLGGYFGSRLMSNIREDKGYTYGIGSAVVSLSRTGYFFISTEVGADVTMPALEEIYKEVERLRHECVDESELSMVRNYMLGSFLKSIDGPFSLIDRFKSIHLSGLDYSYYQRYLKTLETIGPEELRALAFKYYDRLDLLELVVGVK